MNYSHKIDIKNLMENEFDEYKKRISQSTDMQMHLNLINTECNNLLTVIDEYELGKTYKAFQTFNNMLNELKQSLRSIIIDNKTPDNFVNKSFYRMRKSNTKITDIKEMFHIPISKRNKVKTQRYSIPGCPCLYLSSSVYTCWNEMHQPPIHELYVSKFVMNSNTSMKLLNFTLIDPRRMYFKTNLPEFVSFKNDYELKLDPGKIKDAFILWPLLFSCTIRGSDENDSFKPEYIIPQFLLQWIRENEIVDGIGYLSAEADSTKIDPLWCINYVFPVKDYDNDICSILASQFKITQPERCDNIENIMKGYAGEGSKLKCQRFFPGKKYADIHYESTIYGTIEKYLDRLDPERIDFIE